MDGAGVVVQDVAKRFGAQEVLRGITFDVAAGERFGIVGPNGAGKSVLLNGLSGMDPFSAGRVSIGGTDTTRRTPAALARQGVARTFQLVEYFKEFTAAEYVTLSRLDREKTALWRCVLRQRSARRTMLRERRAAAAYLDRFGLGEVADHPLESLPYGVQKMVDVVRAVAAEPRVLLLDEPTTGTGKEERERLAELLTGDELAGITVLFVDHDVSFVASCCQRVMAINFGTVIAIDEPDQLFRDPRVVESYLGAEIAAG